MNLVNYYDLEPSNKKFVEKFKFFAALTSSSASLPTCGDMENAGTTTHKSMITIGAPPATKKPVAKSLSDVSYNNNNNANHENNKNYRENNNKLVNNITTVLITNDNTEVINHYLLQQSGYDSLPCSYANLNEDIDDEKSNIMTEVEKVKENEENLHQSMITIPTQTLPVSNKPKRLMRKIGKLMLPKMFLNESNNNNGNKKFKDPIIEDLIKKNHDKASKVGRIKSLFMSSSVNVEPETPDSQNDSGKENESGNENGIGELKRQWSIRSDTKIHTNTSNRRISQYFNGSKTNQSNILSLNDSKNESEAKKNTKNKEKLSISINQTFDMINNTHENITPITPIESPIYFSDTSCSVSVNESHASPDFPLLQRRMKQSTPLIQAVKRRIVSHSFPRFHQRQLFPVIREFDDIQIEQIELMDADAAFEKLYQKLLLTF